MKRRICFAGFGEAEVESLRPAAAELRSSWECVFCADGEAALAKLARDMFAAMVVDLRMEGMSGVGLLQLIAGDYPGVLRFALGDFSDREAVAGNLGAPHQFIARPLNLKELTSIIERSLALDAWLSSDKLRSFVPRLGRLPGLPSTYFEVLKRAESPNATVESVGEIIAHDPALTARLLQTVNSAAAAMGEKITNPVEAVSVLGMDTVKSLVLCLQVFNQSAPAVAASISLDDLWRHSFAAAQLSRKIALWRTSDARLASDAFTAGLLHRVGQIVLTTNMAQAYADIVSEARQEGRSLPEMEQQKLGVTSAQIGAYLLGLWGMPLPLVEVAALCDTPGKSGGREFTLLTAVHVADVLAQEDRPLAEGLIAPKLDQEYLKAMDLPGETAEWRKALAGGHFEAQAAAPEEQEEPPPPKKAPRVKQTREPSRMSFAPLAIGALVIVGGFFGVKWYGAHRHHASAPGATMTASASNPEPDAQAQPDQPADGSQGASPFDSIQIQSILYNPTRPVALINGNPVSPGDRINGMQVVAITRTNVVFSYRGQQRAVKWK